MKNVVMIGHAVKEAEVKTTTGGAKYGEFTVAVNRGKTKEGKDLGTDFFRVVTWNEAQAETWAKYVKKGSHVAVKASPVTGSYKDKDGDTINTLELRINAGDRVEFLGDGGSGDFNSTVVVGRLARDMETKTAGGSKVTNGTIAVGRGKDKDGNDLGADFFRISIWGEYGEKIAENNKKGSMLLVEGRMQAGSYEKEGKKFPTYDLISNKVVFLTKKQAEAAKADESAMPDNFEAAFEAVEEEIPF